MNEESIPCVKERHGQYYFVMGHIRREGGLLRSLVVEGEERCHPPGTVCYVTYEGSGPDKDGFYTLWRQHYQDGKCVRSEPLGNHQVAAQRG